MRRESGISDALHAAGGTGCDTTRIRREGGRVRPVGKVMNEDGRKQNVAVSVLEFESHANRQR